MLGLHQSQLKKDQVPSRAVVSAKDQMELLQELSIQWASCKSVVSGGTVARAEYLVNQLQELIICGAVAKAEYLMGPAA